MRSAKKERSRLCRSSEGNMMVKEEESEPCIICPKERERESLPAWESTQV